MIPYNHIAVFAAVVRNGSFTAAAQQLDMPKSTVSLKLSQLEAELGVRLLQRSTRQLSTTDEGQRFYEQCRELLDGADTAMQSLKGLQAEPKGTLKLSLPFGLSGSLMPEIIARYQSLYPKVKVEVRCSNDWVDIIKEGFDLALRAGPLMDSALIGRELCPLQRHLVASPDYLKKHGSPDKPRDLSQHSCVVSSYTTHWEFSNNKGRQTIKPQQAIVSNDQDMIRELLLQGAGIGVVTDINLQAAIRQDELVPVMTNYTMVGRSLHLVYPSRELLSPHVKQFIDLAVTAYNEQVQY